MLDQKFLKSVPHSPGVYLMIDASSAVVYVGKAKDLAKRLASYVNFSGPAYSKTAVMLTHVEKADILITRTEKEALILEASLIKRHKAKYNVILRDDKSYPLIKVTVQEEWPRVFMTRRKKNDGARYFGPYASASAMWSTLKLLSSLFPLRRCKGSHLKPRRRPCLNYQMNRCLAPCAGIADKNEYQAMVERVVMFLDGRNKDLLKHLEAEMAIASKNLAFERAAAYRDQISALNRTLEKQLVVSQSSKDLDVFGFARHGTWVATTVLYIRGGTIRGSRSYGHNDPYGDDSVILSQVVKQIYSPKSPPPADLLLPHRIEDQPLLAEHLSDLADRKVRLSVPQRGDRVSLVSMANNNATQYFEEKERKAKSWQALGESIAKKLRLEYPPDSIECVDISNISGTHAVGSLVRFTRGEPDKKWYRHYKVATVQGPDDYSMMKEVINRRFKRGMEADDIPDLFMVDGGKGQLGIAIAAAQDMGLESSINLLAIAKEKEDEGEKLYRPNRRNPILLVPHDPVLLYLMRIRDETHRFGITFHRSLRRKNSLASQLDQIDGIGPQRRKLLLAGLGSIRNLAQASLDDLLEIKGVGPDLAQKIKAHFSSVEHEG
jgi:excinuclease ABC subunit C